MRRYLGMMMLMLLAACAGQPPAGQSGSRAVAAAQASPDPTAPPLSPRESCPVTRPSEPPFVPPAPYPAQAPGAGNFWYGGAGLWTRLPDDGAWTVPAGMGEKVFWWREGFSMVDENRPALAMTGRRLDGPADPAEASPATSGAHADFGEFMLLGLSIPAGGCWELTGAYRQQTLTFVVWVDQ